MDFMMLMCLITHVHIFCQQIFAIPYQKPNDLPSYGTARHYKIILVAAIFAPESS